MSYTLTDFYKFACSRGLKVDMWPDSSKITFDTSYLNDMDKGDIQKVLNNLPDLAAMLYGLLWHKRKTRFEQHYNLSQGKEWINKIILERFEAKHGFERIDIFDIPLSIYLFNGGSEKQLIKDGRTHYPEAIKHLEDERDVNFSRINAAITRLIGVNESSIQAKKPNGYDPALIDVLNDLDPVWSS